MKPLRLALVALALSGGVAFAPAPLPRSQRRGPAPEITLQSFQGLWRATGMVRTFGNGEVGPQGYSWTHARVVNDRWTFMSRKPALLNLPGSEGNPLFITIDHTRKPALMNFYDTADKRNVSGVGLLRKHNGKVQLMYRWGGEKDRPLTFETAPAGLWIVTLEK